MTTMPNRSAMTTMPNRSLHLVARLTMAAAMFVGCGTDNTNPYGGTVDTARNDAAPGPGPGPVSPSADAGPRPASDAAPGIDPAPTADAAGSPSMPGPTPPAPGQTPIPARFIVLGDSITACSNVGNENGANCSAKKLFDYLKATYAPALTYENGAVGAAVTADVPEEQLGGVTTGPGHALVLIYIGGNDLARYLFSSDAAAERGYNTDLAGIRSNWDAIFAFFQDKTKFPDGTTVLMNNQYNPFDGCTAPPYFLSAKKNELLDQFNQELAAIAAAKGGQLTDQHTPYLGHGHHYAVRNCPHYQEGMTPWMDDLIHPNAAGHDGLFQQWKAKVDGLYR